jgi:hypothetical protein
MLICCKKSRQFGHTGDDMPVPNIGIGRKLPLNVADLYVLDIRFGARADI